MGMTVKVQSNPGLVVQLAAARRRGLIAAGEVILASSSAQAPREETPRHGVHMTETGFVRLEAAQERVAIGYTAYWALWQHEKLEYHHDEGHAKFLELALVAGQGVALETVAAEIRKALK